MKFLSNKEHKAIQDGALVSAFNDIRTVTQRFRTSLFGVSKDGARDLYEVYGYSRSREFINYFNTYRYQDIANRVVGAVARSCWRDRAKIMQGPDTILEKEMQILDKDRMYTMLERADILNRIGRFSVLYVGVPDGLDPKMPLGTSDSSKLNKVFFTPFAEDGITIHKWVTNPIDPRFGMPLLYNLQIMNRGEKVKDLQTQPILVHWSRIIHMAEGALDGGVEGIPTLEPIMNRLIDLDKTIGGSSEAYFRNARGKYSLEADKGFASSLSETAKQDLEEEVNAFTNNWKDAMRLSGVSAKVLTTPHSDPVGTVKVALEAIAGATGIPMRILTGEGAGQLAGNEDKESYNQLIGDRQSLVCTEWMTRLLGIISEANMIDLPDDFEISWPVASALNEIDQARIAKDNAEAFKWVMEGMEKIEEPDTKLIFEKVLGMEIDGVELAEAEEAEEPKAPLQAVGGGLPASAPGE